jgi:hypothetical protein
MRRLLAPLALGSVAILATACFNKPQPACAFLCGPANACPDNYTCAADNRCHLVTASGLAQCQDSLPIDAAPPGDAPLPDAAPADAAPVDANTTLMAVSVVPASLVHDATGNVTIQFTLANLWPLDGKLVVIFPGGFMVSGATFVSIDGASGDLALAISNLTITGTRPGMPSAGNTAGGTAVTVVLAGIVNPGPGSTGTFAIATQTAAGTEIDHGTAAGVDIQ